MHKTYGWFDEDAIVKSLQSEGVLFVIGGIFVGWNADEPMLLVVFGLPLVAETGPAILGTTFPLGGGGSTPTVEFPTTVHQTKVQ